MRQKSIQNELLMAFIVIALIPIALVGQYIYSSVYEAHIQQVLSSINKIADKKVEQINAYSLERLQDAKLLAASASVRQDIEHLQSAFYQYGSQSTRYKQLLQNTNDAYQNMVKIGGFYDVFLISTSGDIIFTAKHEADLGTNLRNGAYKDSELAKVFSHALKSLNADFSSYRYYSPSQADAAFVAAPVIKNQRVIGVVALQINSQVFQQVVQDNMSLGNSSETIVARAEGHDGYLLFPLKFKAAFVKNNRFDLTDEIDAPLLNALRGLNSGGVSKDYRGHNVIASWRYIPSVKMGMVIKIDTEEALASFENIQRLQSLYLLSLFTCLGLCAIYLRRFLLTPVNKLMFTAHKIAEGDMSQRVPVTENNEIGRLGIAFNAMVDKLQLAYDTSEQVAENRTADLQRVIKLLNEKIAEREKISAQLKEIMAFQKAILNSNNFCIISTDRKGVIMTFNAAAEKTLGYKSRELINQHTPAIFHDHNEVAMRAKKLRKELGRVIEPGFDVFIAKTDYGADENEWTYIHKNGTRIPMRLSVTAILNEHKQKIGYLGISADITEQKRVMEELQLAHSAIEHISEGIVITDSNGIISSVNPGYTRIMGYEREEVVGKNPGFTKSGRHDKAFYQAMWGKLYATDCWEGEIWDKRKDGTIFPKWLNINAIRNSEGNVIHYVGIFMDISQQKTNEEKLQRMAFYDPLTQLPNRALFRELLNQELLTTKRNRRQVALFFIDLDRFKWVNDNLGHDIGDNLLIEVAARLKKAIRESDSACRLGGDEFTVILSNLTHLAKVPQIAQKIINSLSSAFEIQGHQIFIGASIGISIAPKDGEDFDTITKHADMAMYQAKDAGRGTYKFYQADFDTLS